MEENPLECIICRNELSDPILLACHHTVCRRCRSSNSSSCITCQSSRPSTPSTSSRTVTPQPDKIAAFLLDASKEQCEECANCEQTSLPMFYCEQCQQSLCLGCRQMTHQARMFATHKIVNSEERSKVYGSSLCKEHGEPYILYCSDIRKLVCIQCFNGRPLEERHSFISIDQGHRICLEKIEQAASKLRFYQTERLEELQVRQRIMEQNESNFEDSKTSIYQICQQIIDTVLTTRERLTKELEKQKNASGEQCAEQIRNIESVLTPVRLCLFSAQIMCTTASKLDVLQLCGQLQKRINTILDVTIEKLPTTGAPDNLEARSELAKALEPYLGLSAAWCPISASRESSNSYKRGSMPMLSKFQTTIDLAGAFGQLFGRVEHPLRKLIGDLAETGQQVLETQRDLTTRKCLIEKGSVDKLVGVSRKLEAELGMHSAALDGMQSEMQEIWQEQLDRVRRQQIIYREKVEEVFSLRETARQVLTASKQLAPYVTCILSMNQMIDPKRCHPPDPAPMESICLEITGIEPNSETRILAIEKEEENRRMNQEAKKKEELAGQMEVVKTLKHGKARRKDGGHRSMVNMARERSPGGTDVALISPCFKRLSTASVKEETTSELDAEEFLDFDFMVTGAQDDVDMTMFEEDRCSSALQLPLDNLPSLDQLLGRIPLATRVTSDVGVCRGAMLQSLNDVFAQQKSPIPEHITVSEERNVLASAVRDSEKRGPPQKPTQCPMKEEPIERKVTKKRVKQKDLPSPSTIPEVPFIPQEIFEKTDEHLGTFEAKERMLQSLKEKIRSEKVVEEEEEEA